jgi:hypothetical protein
LALVARLKAVLQDFSARDKSLEDDFRARFAAEARSHEANSKKLAEEQSQRLAQAEAAARESMTRWQTRFDHRKVRINEAHKIMRRRVVENVTEQEGRDKHKLQQRAMGAQRNRDSALANAAEANAQFHQKLTEHINAIGALEHDARKVFSGFLSFKSRLSPNRKWPEPDTSRDEIQLFEEIQQLTTETTDALARFRKSPFRVLIHFTPPAWLLAIAVGVLAVMEYTDLVINHSTGAASSFRTPLFVVGALILLRLVLYVVAQKSLSSDAHLVAANLAKIKRLQDAAWQKADVHLKQDQERLKTEFADSNVNVDQEYKRVMKDAILRRSEAPLQMDEKARRINEHNERFRVAKLDQLEDQQNSTLSRLKLDIEAEQKRYTSTREQALAAMRADEQAKRDGIEAEWKATIIPLVNHLQELSTEADKRFPEWRLADWQNWTPPQEFLNAARFARLSLDLDKLADIPAGQRRLNLPCPSALSVPLALAYPREGSILLETGKAGADDAVAAINNIIFRLLATTPPGKASFTIFDPVGLGQSFAGIMHLADYEDANINSRIWTQTGQFEEKLAELNEHMEKVIQMYLRNEYETIAEYNAQAGSIAEKYHFLVIASFPVSFSDTAARRLRNIAASGARCGVYTLVQWDTRQPLPQDFVPDELRKNSVRLVRTDRGFEFVPPLPGARLELDPAPSPEFATEFLHKVGEFSKGANRVEVPFEQIAPPEPEIWKEETTEELRVPIGRSGATKWQYLAIGRGTRQHALIAGKTGSGKSTLFHVIVTNLSLWCSPDQVEFYLVDFKKGVEFKCYAARRLPHARVVAIESDRQFGLSVLERVDAELRRRGDLFRKLGVQDLPGYKRAGGTEKLPRSLLMIDEFQEFFTEEDRISQGAAVLLDRIVRQGRAFGIHVLLGSQTLGGAYTLARATLGQMVIRIALQCNEADAYLIMDQDNPAPRLLSRPGEGIYNDEAGSIAGNNPFQVVWLDEETRDQFLAKIRTRADSNGRVYPGPFVFEGNAPADIRENTILNNLLENGSRPSTAGENPRIFLGAPNSIKGPTEAVFQAQSGSNLMLVGQSEESTLAILTVLLVSLANQYRSNGVRLILLDSLAPGSPQADYLDRVIQSIPQPISRPKGMAAITETFAALATDLQNRSSEGEEQANAPITFLIVHGLENFKKLRAEDEFSFSSSSDDSGPNPAQVLQTLITEGPSHRIHLIITCDTFNNISRFLGRKALSEFSMRVLFQMSASDSASLIDTPEAGTLGLHRALLYNDREGSLETFRPYARPGHDWLEEVSRKLGAATPAH